ncbi:hypothetical protein DIS18_04345 [Algibacter marinivivus]|uniref:Secretion system C-terminal sorting domain-containing protein n=1 Tax=Algibacter marinivivus TaxID=2100723 RepID=A0A2U2X7M5_9FLAO|nr:T9SS type A sorting domain-containing protein [Algibacter marinivivus]PWH83788.1 hypothetical protein DIS18_04345 [Algibacter marinivivus]
MKSIFFYLFLFIISHMSFSQERIRETNLQKDTVFKFHPNPAQDDLYILGENKIKSIELINVLGKRVAFYHFNKSIIQIDVSELKSGLYLIQVIDENNMAETKKLVIK